jgi:hypothetical protein
MSTEMQAWLRLDRPVTRQRPRDPVGKSFLFGPHSVSLSFARVAARFLHRKHLRQSYGRQNTVFGGLFK